LRATGLSRQEIAKRYVPLSFSESKEEEKKKETDFKQLQNDVESLKAQVQSLQKIIKEDRHENDGATSGENRKENEERKRREPRQDNEEQHRMNLNVSVGASVKKTEQN